MGGVRAGTVLGAAAPDPSALGVQHVRFFLCSPGLVDTRSPLQHDLSEGTIKTDKASRVPLHIFTLFYIVHI